jgi:2-dehydrotetronate isomerase
MPRFAANLTMMFNEWAFLDRFEAAADAGFKAVEYLFPYAEAPEAITTRLHRHGLTQALFNAPPGDWAAGERGLAALPGRSAEFRASIATALTYVAATNVKRLHVMSGNADARNPENARAFEESLRYACAAAAKAGIDIVIEPINSRDMPAYFLNDFRTAVDIIQRLELPNLKLQYDIYHRQILHGDVLKSLEQMMPLIGHIQIASVPARNEPGTGELNDFRIFEKIDELNYQGFVGCEYRPANGTVAGLIWMKSIVP